MLQEDSNGEASFEIIDKKNDQSPQSANNTESTSGFPSPYLPSGLQANLPPSSNIPVTLWQGLNAPIPAPTPLPPNLLPPTHDNKNPPPVKVQPAIQSFPQPQFSAAIPPSKGIQHGPPLPQNVDAINQGGGLIGWMREAVSTGGLFSNIAEKAKNSVDSLITTLDPQMSEFIHSGGDLEVIVASQNPDEVTPIRDAIFEVFGKAWVNGINAVVEENKHQACSFEEGLQRAEKKIEASLKISKVPTISVENIILEIDNRWFDLSVLLLNDPENQIRLHTFSQTTPIPVDLFVKNAETEIPGYAKNCDSTEKLLSAYLQILGNNWQEIACGVSRKATLFLAAKGLVTIYKNKLMANK